MDSWLEQTRSISAGLWLGAFGVLFVATASGFCAGLFCARLGEKRAYDRARSGLAQLFETMLKTLDVARELCALLEKYPPHALQAEQTAVLEERRGGLFKSLSNLIARHAPALAAPAPFAPPEAPPLQPKPIQVDWLRNPIDPSTELPDRSAFESNLSSLLAACSTAGRESCLLVVRIDKMTGLVARFGQANVDKLLKRLAHVVCRCVRDDDLVCRCNSETLAVLFPGLDMDAGTRLGRVIRDAVRNQTFHVDQTGAQVLLTASFGCTPCRPQEHGELVLNRAFDALAQSQRRGRNQLHVHTGQSLVHCEAE